MSGQAFESRLTTGSAPNRTMSSYIEGKKKRSHDSCMVRGFWGDILNSPFVPIGYFVDDEVDRDKFGREYNMSRPYDAGDVSAYTITSWLFRLENLERFFYRFELLEKLLGKK